MTPLAYPTEGTTVVIDVDMEKVPECAICTTAADWRAVCLGCRRANLCCDGCLQKLYELIEGITALSIALMGQACYTPCCNKIINRVADSYDISLL